MGEELLSGRKGCRSRRFKYDGWLKEEEWGKLHPLPAWDRTIEDYPTPPKGFDSAEMELRKVIEVIVARRNHP